ncbi:MAG TPA: hypothetical protein VFH31_05270 [Pyrinomonadaceae bacterium]|nr:hypothetical protein [Pyrinomonadaceae bacterium]
MNELIERLRASCENGILPDDTYEAADALEQQVKQIEELKAENTTLRNAMQQANTAIAAGDSIIADLRAQLAEAKIELVKFRESLINWRSKAWIGTDQVSVVDREFPVAAAIRARKEKKC